MMVGDTENRKAAHWLPDNLLTEDDRGDLLASVNPALLLAGDGRLPLWASDAAARALGFRNADVFMRRRLADAAPGAQRLAELASTLEAGEAPRLERLRFYVGFRRVSVTASCQVIHLMNGSRALLVSFPAEAEDDEEGMVPQQPEVSGTQIRTDREAALEQFIPSSISPAPKDDALSSDSEMDSVSPHHDLAEPFLMENISTEQADAIFVAPVSPHADPDVLPQDQCPAWLDMPAHTRRMQRFVFTIDAEGTVLSLSPALCDAVGESQAFKVGDNLVDVLSKHDAHASLQIERAIAAQEIWSDIHLDWPVAGSTLILPITLAGLPNLPNLTKSTAMHGTALDLVFSGFGRLHFDQARERDTTAFNTELGTYLAVDVDAPKQIEDIELQDEHPHELGQQINVAQGLPSLPENEIENEEHDLIERSSLPLRDDMSEEDELNDEGALHVDMSNTTIQNDVDGEEDDHHAEMIQTNPSPLTDDELNTDSAALTPPEERSSQLRPSNVTQLPPRPVKPSDQPANVVTLRAGQTPPTHGTTPQQGGLSLSERHAFREIAKALGARFDEDTPVDDQRARAAIRGYNAQRQRPVHPGDDETAAGAEQSEEPTPFWPDYERILQTGADASSDTLLSILDKIPIGLLVLKGDEARFANRTLLDLTGYANFATFLHENGVQAIFRKSSQPRTANDDFDTIVLATREGEMIPVDAHLQLIDWQGSPATLLSLRRASELEKGKALRSVAVDLRRARAEATELRNILDTATDGVLTLDEEGKILSLNSAAEALFGLNQNEVVGESFIQLLMNESHAEALDYIEGMKANGVKSVLNDGREVKARERNGGLIPLFMTLGRISEEEPRRFCAVLRDLTAWKQAETQLQDAKRAAESASAKKSDFLTRISHEIRTPINAMIGFAEVMEEERLGPIHNPRYKEYLGDIRVSGHHIVSLVNDLLDLAKIEAGRLELSFAATDINAIVASCIALMQPQANSARVLVRSQIAAKLPKIVADERSVRQIVLNMLSNATRYTQSGGQVIVSTALLENGEAVIRIRDTGVGMSKAEIEKALEPFQQVGTWHKPGGTGLGLPLTKALVEANRANFSIRSTPGEGTLVEITFPSTRVLAE